MKLLKYFLYILFQYGSDVVWYDMDYLCNCMLVRVCVCEFMPHVIGYHVTWSTVRNLNIFPLHFFSHLLYKWWIAFVD